jgi:methyltransferase (TIGR00027 family)
MEDVTSRSAEHVALFRALESARRHGRLFDDPYAAGFLTGWYRIVGGLVTLAPVRRGVERFIDWRWPAGPRASAVVRTRLIDDLVGAGLAAGATQVVLLGAGYDSRAYRIPAMAKARVFEVDHPATQATKRRLVNARVPIDRRSHVSFVPVDLVRDHLDPALRRAGFAAGEPAIVVWEGVTNYLTGEAVDATLRGLAEITGTGSRIIFTYVDRGALDGTGGFAGVQRWHAALSRHGEPWTFGLDPATLSDYLAQRQLRLRRCTSVHKGRLRWSGQLLKTCPSGRPGRDKS